MSLFFAPYRDLRVNVGRMENACVEDADCRPGKRMAPLVPEMFDLFA